MAGNDLESWVSWHEEDSFKLDPGSPVAMSRSLWDEIPHGEEESSALFASTPAAEIAEAGAVLSCINQEDTEQQHCVQEHDSPHQKRRRMLLFPGADRCSEEYEQREEEMNSAWYMDTGESSTPAGASYEQQRWVTSWFKTSCQDQNGRIIQLPASQSAKGTSGAAMKGTPTLEKQIPRKFSVESSATDRKRPAIRKSSPVAYPFALLKPCGATGDVTLSDINQRIQTIPPRSGRRMELETPSTAPVAAANEGEAGLSGKSVVALTKIHTEGNGSITIMRTRG